MSGLLKFILGSTLFLTPVAYAQTASVTATCKDGTSFSGATRSGACRGHHGVATWNTAGAGTAAGTAAGKTAGTSTATTTGTAPTTTPSTGSTVNPLTGNRDKSPAASAGKTGAPGQVWVNSATKVYHCPGDRYYGKTKAGEFMSQSAAQAAGDRPSGGKACAS